MPSLALLQMFLLQPTPPEPLTRRIHFTLADYNAPVLRLVTLPNILLLWSLLNGTTEEEAENDLEITPEIIEEFKLSLSKRGISLDFISGSWSPDFVDTVFESGLQDGSRSRRTLVLASETIYSPSSLRSFSETLVSLLRRGAGADSGSSARAFVAAKRVYFGVGGGVDEFLSTLKDVDGDAVKVNGKQDVEDGGVGRVILDVALGR
jgi:protein-histidine N-methyltransferase